MGAEMAARHALRQRLFERLDHGVDHGREGRRVVAHRRGRLGAEDLARRQYELERTEGAFVRHLAGAEQIFERDARRGLAAAEPAGIDRALHLIGDAGIVDGHLVAVDDDLDADRQRLVAGAVVVEKGLRGVDAVRHRADQRAGGGLRLVEDDLDRACEGRRAVFVDQLSDEIAPQQAAGELRRDVAHQLGRLAGVVLDDAVDFLDRLALRPQLDRAKLQALHENVGRMRHAAADVDPVHVDGEEADQTDFSGPTQIGVYITVLLRC